MTFKHLNIYYADLNPPKGTEVEKKRRVLVVQTNLLNDVDHPSTLICPITRSPGREEDNLLRVEIEPSYQNGLKELSEILIDQIRAIDNKRFDKKVMGKLDKKYYKELTTKLKIVMSLN